MSRSRILKVLLAGWIASLVLAAPSAFACAACYGKSDSSLAEGMNWGIFSLLAIVVCVLGAIAGFFVFLAKKSAAISAAQAASGQMPGAAPQKT
jgi:hypothetical protein